MNRTLMFVISNHIGRISLTNLLHLERCNVMFDVIKGAPPGVNIHKKFNRKVINPNSVTAINADEIQRRKTPLDFRNNGSLICNM